jgi:hypothetical protein
MLHHSLLRRIAAALLLAVVALGVLPSSGHAQGGESAVPFLLIAPNSRASGIGEAGTGTVDDASAIFWNPGALAFLPGTEITHTHAKWLPQFDLSDLFYEHMNFRTEIPAIGGVIGASITYLNLGEFTVTNSSGPTPIATFKSYEYAVTAGYATKVTDDLGVGINLRFIHSALSPIGTENEKGNGIASTVSADVAMMWRPKSLDVPLLGDIGKAFSLGLNLSNLGPKITYIDAAQADPIPTTIRLGLGYKIFEDEYNSMQATVDFARLLIRRDTSGHSDPFYKALFSAWGDGGLQKVTVGGGIEYWYGAPRLLALRWGYFYESPKYGARKFMTFGAGVRIGVAGVDFSYISAAQGHPLSDTIRFSLLFNWGVD